MIKFCEICGQEFETIPNGGSRKYCFDCVPVTADSAQRTVWKRNAAKREGVKRLGNKCEKCGEQRVHILEFHHVDPTTKDEIPSRILANSKIQEFFEEIQKCILLCSNCHQDFHYLEAHNKELTLQQYLDNDIE